MARQLRPAAILAVVELSQLMPFRAFLGRPNGPGVAQAHDPAPALVATDDAHGAPKLASVAHPVADPGVCQVCHKVPEVS